ncbi:hypothetical protein SRS16CHR_03079 [Variovorax sp. SRS16]|uniref:hypothetical protein n=1 Tax=Variovorax sp. SRS16 TaxID=282217 RepID=UPI001318FEF3|nr:hypothetical protein [Variovorax sp. SRS16]VTU22580.1 hypothetical protein SRS16CHR_03079 [Variovorax sp. SRS16]
MDHTHVGLRAAVRALADVVAPAVDPTHAQARDQLRLTIDYLEFVLQRLDHLHERELFELRHHMDLARQVLAVTSACAVPCSAALGTALERGEKTLAEGNAPPPTLRNATVALAAAVAQAVRAAPQMAASARQDIEARVLHASKTRIAFERAWYLPLGLDADSHEVLPLSETLG